jgi:outer membrane lipoprotein-sorting protein
MIRTLAALVVLGLALPAWAQKKPCEELKAEIEAKLKAKGVEKYTLDIVPADSAKDAKVVGSCDGGAKRIVYKRG